MTSYTPNLKLLKKDPSTDGNDTFNITTMLNDNWDKVDTAFADKMSKDFSNVAYDSLGFDNFVNNLCDLKALTRLTIGSYVGTGTYGSENPNSLTFDFEPRVVFIAYGLTQVCFYKGSTKAYVYNSLGNQITPNIIYIDDCTNTISWHSTNNATYHMNVSDKVYVYTAIG